MCPTIENLLPSHARGELDVMDAFSVNLHLEGCGSCRAAFARLSEENGSVESGLGHRMDETADLRAVRTRSLSWERRAAAPSLVERLRSAWRDLGRPWKAALVGAAAAGILTIPIAKLPGVGGEPVVLASQEAVELTGELLRAPLPKTPPVSEIAVAAVPRKPRRTRKVSPRAEDVAVRSVAARPVRRQFTAPVEARPSLPLAPVEAEVTSEPVAVALIHGLGPEPVAVPVTKPNTRAVASGYVVIWNAGPEPLFVPVVVEPAEIRAQAEF